jgi:TetR/AcrR family transcriptional repressor of mexJK operon
VKTDKSTQIKVVPRRSGRPTSASVADLDRTLIRVARQFFVAKGYGATSITEIANTARASKGTLYARFPTKADLFRAILDEQIRRTGGEVRQVGPKPKTLQAMLRIFAERALADSLSAETLQLNRLIVSEAERFPELAEAAFARGRVGVKQISRYIQEYAQLDGISCRHPEIAADMFLQLTRGWYSERMLRNGPVSSKEIRAWVRQMVHWFMATRKTW